MSSVRFTRLIHPVSGTWVRWTTGRPSRSSTPARKVMYWSRSGTTRTSATVRPTSWSTVEHRAVRVERQSEKHRVDATLVHDPRDLGGRAEHRHPWCCGRALAGGVVDEPDRAEARLRVLEELVHHGAAQAAGADDEDVPHADAVPPGLLEIPADRGAPREHEEDVETEEEQQDEPRVREAPVERREAREQQRGQPRRDEDREPLFDARAVAADLVEAVEVVDDRPQDGDQGKEAVVRGRVRNSLGDRDDLRPEAQKVGGDERHERGAHVRDGEQRGDAPGRFLDHGGSLQLCERFRKLPGEPLSPERQRRGADFSVIESGLQGPAEGLREPRGGLVLEEDAVDAVAHEVAGAPARQRDDRGAAAEGFHGGDAEVLLPGLEEGRAGAIEVAQLLRALSGQNLYGSRRETAEARLLRAAADQHEPPAEAPGRLDRQVVSLVRHEGPDPEKKVPAGAGVSEG